MSEKYFFNKGLVADLPEGFLKRPKQLVRSESITPSREALMETAGRLKQKEQQADQVVKQMLLNAVAAEVKNLVK